MYIFYYKIVNLIYLNSSSSLLLLQAGTNDVLKFRPTYNNNSNSNSASIYASGSVKPVIASILCVSFGLNSVIVSAPGI